MMWRCWVGGGGPLAPELIHFSTVDIFRARPRLQLIVSLPVETKVVCEIGVLRPFQIVYWGNVCMSVPVKRAWPSIPQSPFSCTYKKEFVQNKCPLFCFRAKPKKAQAERVAAELIHLFKLRSYWTNQRSARPCINIHTPWTFPSFSKLEMGLYIAK